MYVYYFMSPEHMNGIQDINKYISDEYGKDLLETFVRGYVKTQKNNAVKENGYEDDSVLEAYISELIKEEKIEKKINSKALNLSMRNAENQMRWDIIANNICNIIMNPANYYEDILAAIFMGSIYNEDESDFFRTDLYKEEKFEQFREKIQSVWIRGNNNVDKGHICGNYPMVIIDEEVPEKSIKSMPGGCYKYHETMISQSNINIFDPHTIKNDYTRYSFKKMHKIFEELKNSSIDNLLLMEYSLGVGYTNQMYPYLWQLRTKSQIEKILEIIRVGAEIIPFVLRMKIMNIIFNSGIDLKSENDIENATKVLVRVRDIVSELFEATLRVGWYKYHYFLKNKQKRFNELILVMECMWKKYFNEEIVYLDWIDSCRIHDWRDISNEEDCFFYVAPRDKMLIQSEDNPLKVGINQWGQVSELYINNIFGKKEVLIVEAAKNEIGITILERVRKEMERQQLPKSKKEIRELFYRLRKEIFEELKKEEGKLFYAKEVKIRDNNRKSEQKLEGEHIYSLICYEVIKQLLSN